MQNTIGHFTLMWDDAKESERWAIDEGRGGLYFTSSLISISTTFFTKPDKKITFFRLY